MVKYTGDEVEVRLAATQAGLTSATPLTNVSGVEWKVAQGVVVLPVGLGSRSTEAQEKLITYSGLIERWHDETPVAGYSNFRNAVQAFQTGIPNYLFVEIKNKTTGKKVQLSNCKGNYAGSKLTPDGFMMEAWDFFFETITEI